MSPQPLLDELRLARSLLAGLLEDLDEATWRAQAHPALSPPGWHLGHCAFIEAYWLQEVILGDDRHTAPVADLYVPTRTPKAERGARLPSPPALAAWAVELQAVDSALLEQPPAGLAQHPLMQDDYLLHFLVQHYSQHFETLQMVLTQHALASDTGDFRVDRPLQAVSAPPDTVGIDAGNYRVGGQAPVACDNELPVQQATLGPYAIARKPVTNAGYLAFMQAGGYADPGLWDDAGRNWLQATRATAPDHWRRNADGHWYGVGSRGAYALSGDAVLHGICRHEARAYARWADARLPHEHQWEVACRLQLLEATGHAWEWCANPFYPYEGFRPFPYDGYSAPWFDGRHYTLRGGSLHTRPAVRRASFRNFYEPGMRHIFAGLRLVYDR